MGSALKASHYGAHWARQVRAEPYEGQSRVKTQLLQDGMLLMSKIKRVQEDLNGQG